MKSQACDWRTPWLLEKSAPSGMISDSNWKPGDLIFVKPSLYMKYTEPWKPDVIKSVISGKIVELSNGIRRHIADIRRRVGEEKISLQKNLTQDHKSHSKQMIVIWKQ